MAGIGANTALRDASLLASVPGNPSGHQHPAPLKRQFTRTLGS